MPAYGPASPTPGGRKTYRARGIRRAGAAGIDSEATTMNVPFKPAHSPFGGSVAARILRCPAALKLVEKVPEYLRKSSAYANRGSALHVATARLIERECSLDDLVGKTIDDYTITRDDVENALRPVLAYVEALLDAPGAEFFLEQRVVFPTVADAFGTADLIVRIGNTIHVIDFKFGAACASSRSFPTATRISLTRSCCFTPRPRATRLPEFFAGVDNYRPDDPAAGCRSSPTPRWYRPSR